MSRIEQSYFFYSDAARYLDITLEEFRYLVAEGYIRYGIDMRGNPDNCVSVSAAEEYFERGKHLKVGDVCHDDFVYFNHSSFHTHALTYAHGDEYETYEIYEFEDFSGQCLRIFDIASDGSVSNSDLYSSRSIQIGHDSEGFLLNVRFTKLELDRYQNREKFVPLESPSHAGLEDFIRQKNQISLESDLDWFAYQKPPRSRPPSKYLWKALNMYHGFHGAAAADPTVEGLLSFMDDYTSLTKRHKHWRLIMRTQDGKTVYSFEPDEAGERRFFNIDSIRQSISNLQQYKKSGGGDKQL